MTGDNWEADTRASYDTVAESYADQVRGAIAHYPYLRAALAAFAESTGGGPVADIGCGPGEVTAHLNELGVEAFGIDLSPAMIALARRTHPGLRFEVGSMVALELPAASVGGLLAWQSLIHVPDAEIPAVLAGFHRVLRPGGPLQLLFHVGDTSRLKTEGYGGHPMKVRVHRRRPERVSAWLRAAGFEVEAELLLDPAAEVPQAVLFARRG
ncbi:class I SAM-dependent DNA methyltransferase [Amycolatopsis albispora]|uniref:Methyltransferase n=1 Tax=Amycolatopsis albispora TaxID=1804986 RepID=A0A344LJM7_9PSEU|nr:class I SAM-dependent methyltransferase [Amycolatopsis albispora]AXB48251.1 methyltransferase [Amycolatopsis albispora]